MKPTFMYFLRGALLVTLWLFSEGASSQTTPQDPALWLGMTPETAYRELGAPSEVFPVAADATRWQVAQFYPSNVTLYWYANHVWQVRLDRRYTGGFLGLTMGQTRDSALVVLGPPAVSSAPGAVPAWDSWALPFRAFSRQVRLVFENGLLFDASFYRSDL
ncbi:MAG: hypothetical protein WCG80_18005 [Spirochaetales bacterium]